MNVLQSSPPAAGRLAIDGGRKTIARPIKTYTPLGREEVEAVCEVVKSKVLSGFLGGHGEGFLGGSQVQLLEKNAEDFFGVKYAVAMNSLTSGLIAALGAIDLQPGDEVITTPWSWCSTATSILHWNSLPVFADIDHETFNLDPESITQNITAKTRAVVVADIFGHSCNIDKIKQICHTHHLKLICDSSQSPGALYQGNYAGTLGDIGGFSFNQHKHICCGEGGLMVTDCEKLANRMRLIRNHAESRLLTPTRSELSNMIGYNFRLGEMEAAIAVVQLRKLPEIIHRRQILVGKLREGLKGLIGLNLPVIKNGCTHVYATFPMTLNRSKLKAGREFIVKALQAEGVGGLFAGYQNLHLLPLFQHKVAYGRGGFPWDTKFCQRKVSYKKGICPIAESLHDLHFFGIDLNSIHLDEKNIDAITKAFNKVWCHVA